jgi:Flp pilus assembly pilin Flp
LFRYGSRVAAARRFPLPGERVVRDTRVRNGAAAVSYARILQLLSLLLCGGAAALPVMFWRILETLHAAA